MDVGGVGGGEGEGKPPESLGGGGEEGRGAGENVSAKTRA